MAPAFFVGLRRGAIAASPIQLDIALTPLRIAVARLRSIMLVWDWATPHALGRRRRRPGSGFRFITPHRPSRL